ncbi:unnamed protein product [Lasius platythorax]|uniref:Queuosine 5'-phosphate N-glycosylase/hydrolase n=1 Tax=Lasius platythorax TaxID=488582 RepID=A0AAV2P2S0_9HYME
MAEGNSSDYDMEESLLAAKIVAEKAIDVHINEENIEKMAFHVMSFLLDNAGNWDILTNIFLRPETYPALNSSNTADWLFVLHTLNFSLWNPKSNRQWTVGGSEGYFGLCFAIKRAIDEGKPIWDPKYYTRITLNEFKHIFRSDDSETSLPRLLERFMILRQNGEVLLNKYQGTFVECIKSSEYDADKLIKLLFEEFESYRDEAVFEDLKVRFYSKARSLVSDIWAVCSQKKPVKQKFQLNTKEMMSTMFIDHRATLVLLHFKVLRYSDRLVNRLKNSNEPIAHGSRVAIEIRGCSLFAAYKICKEIRKIKLTSSYLQENYPVMSELFNEPILLDNYLLTFIDQERDSQCLKQDSFQYIDTVYY